MNADDVSERITSVEASASRKIQLDQYEPIETYVGLTAEVEEDDDPDEVQSALSEMAMEAAEDAAMQRHEEYVREEAFGDD